MRNHWLDKTKKKKKSLSWLDGIQSYKGVGETSIYERGIVRTFNYHTREWTITITHPDGSKEVSSGTT